MPDLTPADELRAAAATLRRLADANGNEMWERTAHGVHDGDGSFIAGGFPDATRDPRLDLIAVMDPTVATALVDLLDAAAERMQSTGAIETPDGRVYDAVVGRHHHYWRLALAVARAVNAKEDTDNA